ncbi:MAG: hypothetical protein IT445_12010 [Phycisphaeraceae bacterium]|nr:hypothetical protein [Phycisphaeraceae bacterium]
MATLCASLAGEAVELFEREWQQQLTRTRVRVGRIDCPLSWLMPELLRLTQEFSSEDGLTHMRPLVRRLVLEFDFAGHAAVHDESEQTLECYVDTLMLVLEQVRDDARQRGQWVGEQAAALPPMVG